MNDNEWIAEWLGMERITVNSPDVVPGGQYEWCGSIDFDTDITLWHGSDGLLKEIGTRHKAEEFIDALFALCEYTDDRESDDWEWYLATTHAAQLTAALVKMIEETNDP